MICLNYMYNCFKTLKNTFQNYQACASGYEACQYVSHGNELKLDHPSAVTSSMQKLLPSNIADTYACGIFALTSFVCSEKKYIANYFCPKKTSSFDEYNIKKEEDDDDSEYCYVNEYDLDNDEYNADMSSAFIDEYGSDDEEYDTGVLSSHEDKTKYPPARTLDDSWGFIDSDDLSVGFKDTAHVPNIHETPSTSLSRFWLKPKRIISKVLHPSQSRILVVKIK
ncbi:hypothetical protein MFLAVUS_006901 [Mucor flavus]|uniref:Uncharacterized protein n=1 Tax=Mucor flavus TaxID=439312 RepID=A0ABP9Z2V0_9FUNG